MKVIEGFHINKIRCGTRKGEEYLNKSKKYLWKIPERLDGQIAKGDIVWVHSKKGDKDIKLKVLVVDISESNGKALRSVINISKKGVNNKL